MLSRIACAVALIAALLCAGKAEALNTDYVPALSESQVQYYLQYPRLATGARYGLRDNVGNTMDNVSVLQLTGQPFKYAAVYHTAYPVAGGALRFRVNLAVSNDLMNWTYRGTLMENASMPKLAAVQGSSWIVLAHEQWSGRGLGSTSPSRIAYALFYSGADLINRTVRSVWVQPSYLHPLNGTPSFYELHQEYCGVLRCVGGQFGFHFWNGRKDVNAVTTIRRMFDPRGAVQAFPSTADRYNGLFQSYGVTGNLGERDTLVTTSARYNVQEGNIGRPAASWDKWRIYLYRFTEATAYPDGRGAITRIAPETPGGSRSFGNPGITIVDAPSGRGKVIVVSYFLFSEGAGSGEAGSLLYYFRL